ncbi:MAG: DMT family transporter [Anaerolineae bacterium]|nr:DMT family transporter [Anaerolineae bacterium]
MTTTVSAVPKKVTWQPFAVLAIGLLATSSASIFIRFAQEEGAPSLVISAWRLVVATLILTPIVLARHRQELRTLNRNQIGLAMLAGLLLTVHFASWITSLEYTSVLISVTLVTTNPLFVAVLSPLLLGEKITQKTIGAVVLALIGGVIITAAGGAGSAPKQDSPLLGAVLSLIGSVAVALYFIIGRRLRATMSVIPYIWLTYGAGAIALVILVILAGQLPVVFDGSLSARAYLFMTLTALLPQLIGHSAYNYALGYLSAAFVSLSVLFEPIGSTILAVFAFEEQPTLIQIGGGVAILIALWIASREERRKELRSRVELEP